MMICFIGASNQTSRACTIVTFMLVLLMSVTSQVQALDANDVLKSEKLTLTDSILVVEEGKGDIKSWQANKALVPASLIKLSSAYLALDKWGAKHAFNTDFYQKGSALWVKGYGDPYLVSEELDRLVELLKKRDLTGINSLHIDDSYFTQEVVPGRSSVNDPYNAPLSSVAANFNTVMLKKAGGKVQSAETQTPLTSLADKISTGLANSSKAQRINLQNRDNAQMHFAQLLLIKLGHPEWAININSPLPNDATLIYRHTNSHTVENIIRGMLEFSNNFMANQLFLSLAGSSDSGLKPVNFKQASDYAQQRLTELFAWPQFCVVEGSGLSRKNQLSARQIDDLLVALKPHKTLFKKTKHPSAEIYAKTGTLDGVRTFAGYIGLADKEYRFVFMFNRKVAWRHREQLLTKLVNELIQKQTSDNK